MNLIELNRSLVQLRLSGMAAVMETRLLQAQSENLAPIDLISTLVSDELACRSKRLLERRHKQAQLHKGTIEFDQVHDWVSSKLMRCWITSRYSVRLRIRGSICRRLRGACRLRSR